MRSITSSPKRSHSETPLVARHRERWRATPVGQANFSLGIAPAGLPRLLDFTLFIDIFSPPLIARVRTGYRFTGSRLADEL